MRLHLFVTHFYYSFLKRYRKESLFLQRKAKAQLTLLTIFLFAGFTFIVLNLVYLGLNNDALMVMIIYAILVVSSLLFYKGHYNSSVFLLLFSVVLLLPITAFISTNHEPIKLYNIAIYGIIALLVAGLTAEKVYYSILVGITSIITLSVYLIFFIKPAGLKPFALMIDAYIASTVLVGLSTFISIFLTLQLNRLIDDLLRSNRELDEKVVMRTRQLELSRDRLVETEKLSALGGLISGISHEVNTPLGSSIMVHSHYRIIQEELSSQVAADTEINPAIIEYLEKSDELWKLQEGNLSRMKLLIDNFRKISADTGQNKPVLVDLREELDMTLRLFQKKIESNPGIKVIREGSPELKIVTYPTLLWQLLTHLLENSLYHAFPRGEGVITINYKMESHKLILNYSDNGRGMDEASCKRIFEPFFTTGRGAGRTGLGMITVYNLLKNAGGEIKVESTPGHGTVFLIILPDLSQVETDK